MKKEMTILIAEDDIGHASLIMKNLRRAGITNEILHFQDGQQILDYLFGKGGQTPFANGVPYLLLLDIRMPKMDGVEVLSQIKAHPQLKTMPVIMLTTTDDPREVERCYKLGCSSYVAKPIDYDKFTEAIRQLGLFLMVVEVPTIDESSRVN